jgi:cytochrome c oxidase subunit III
MMEKDHAGGRFGMWLFLYSEIMLFTGLFILYAAYFREYRADFVHAGRELSLVFGTTNTVILLVSSFMVAASITAIRQVRKNLAIVFLLGAIMLGIAFLANKYVEWGHKIHLGIYPNSPKLLAGPPGETMFYSLYYVITGLHGIHIIIGLTLLAASAVMLARGRFFSGNDAVLENCGLYWHLVDLIWIFIFPLFYLIL